MPGFACVPDTPVPDVPVAAAPAAMGGPMGLAVGSLAAVALCSASAALWLHWRSRKQKRLRDNIPTNPTPTNTED
ncbi:hypothetical protein GCM10009734_90730 [Nonomuraea bangladeshensis]